MQEVCIQHGDRDVRATANVRVVGAGGVTPLHRATASADTEVVNVLLEWNADIAVRDTEGMTALQCAVRDGYGEVRELLQRRETVVQDKENRKDDITTPPPTEEAQPSREEIQVGLKELASANEPKHRELLQRFEQLDKKDREIEMLYAVAESDLDSVVVLLKMGLPHDITMDDHRGMGELTLLQLASQNGHNAVVQELVLAHTIGYRGYDRCEGGRKLFSMDREPWKSVRICIPTRTQRSCAHTTRSRGQCRGKSPPLYLSASRIDMRTQRRCEHTTRSRGQHRGRSDG